MNMKSNRYRLIHSVGSMAVLILALVGSPCATAGGLTASALSIFPQEMRSLGYCDLKLARQLPWFQQIQDRLLPDRFLDFRHLVSEGGINPDSQIDGLAWGSILDPTGNEHFVGLAVGQFNLETAESTFSRQHVTFVEVQHRRFWTNNQSGGTNDTFFFFVDANTIAFGERQSLEILVSVHDGGAQSLLANSVLSTLASEQDDPSKWLWIVFDEKYAGTIVNLLFPIARQFPQMAGILGRMKAVEVSLQTGGEIQFSEFQAICGSTDDAALMAALAQADIQYRHYQKEQTNPNFADALRSSTVLPDGNRVRSNVAVNPDELMLLLRLW